MRMKSTLSILLTFAAHSASAKTISVEGTSSFGGPCVVSYEYEGASITAFSYKSSVLIWEILASTPEGYRPQSHVTNAKADIETVMPVTDSAWDLFSSDNLYTFYGVKEDTLGPLSGAYSGTISGSLDAPKSIQFKTEYKAAVITVASEEFECRDFE